MRKLIIFIAVTLIFIIGAFPACSSKTDSEEEKGRIEKMTEETGKKIVDKIQSPIDQARNVQGLEDKRLGGVEDQLKEME